MLSTIDAAHLFSLDEAQARAATREAECTHGSFVFSVRGMSSSCGYASLSYAEYPLTKAALTCSALLLQTGSAGVLGGGRCTNGGGRPGGREKSPSRPKPGGGQCSSAGGNERILGPAEAVRKRMKQTAARPKEARRILRDSQSLQTSLSRGLSCKDVGSSEEGIAGVVVVRRENETLQ